MSTTYNVYCDESCHLENDGQKAMVLGAIWCPLEKTRQIAKSIHQIKLQHGMSPSFEIKWTKVSPANIIFYKHLITFFFDEQDLHFRALIVPDKSKLNHGDFPDQDHDVWYYKMYFDMLKVILIPGTRYRIYLDIKDTQGGAKVAKLHDVLCNNMYDFSREIIERIQLVESKHVEILQLADLLIGSVSHTNRIHEGSKAKRDLVELMKQKSGYSLTKTTLLREEKVNIFSWQPRETQQ